jgi:DnaJ-class molecular chaperone
MGDDHLIQVGGCKHGRHMDACPECRKKRKRKIRRCPVCGGTGLTAAARRCPRCDGMGIINRDRRGLLSTPTDPTGTEGEEG